MATTRRALLCVASLLALQEAGARAAPSIVARAGSPNEFSFVTDTRLLALGGHMVSGFAFTDTPGGGEHMATIESVSASGDAEGLPSRERLLALADVQLLDDVKPSMPGYVLWGFKLTPDFDTLAPGRSVDLAYVIRIGNKRDESLRQTVHVLIRGVSYERFGLEPATAHLGAPAADARATGDLRASGELRFFDWTSPAPHSYTIESVAVSGITAAAPPAATLLRYIEIGAEHLSTDADAHSYGTVPWSFRAPADAFTRLAPNTSVLLHYRIGMTQATGRRATAIVDITFDAPVARPTIVGISNRPLEPSANKVAARAGLIRFTDPPGMDGETAMVVSVDAITGGAPAPLPSKLLTYLHVDPPRPTGRRGEMGVAWRFTPPTAGSPRPSLGQASSLAYNILIRNRQRGYTMVRLVVPLHGAAAEAPR